MEDYLAGKDGSKEQLERILRQNRVKVKLEDGKIKVPARITVALAPTETPTETQSKQAIQQLQQIIEGKTTRGTDAAMLDDLADLERVAAIGARNYHGTSQLTQEQQATYEAAMVVSDNRIAEAAEARTEANVLEKTRAVGEAFVAKGEQLQASGNADEAQLYFDVGRLLQSVKSKDDAIFALQAANRLDHALFMDSIRRQGWTDLYSDLQAVDKKATEFSANDVDEIKKLLEQVRTSAEKGSELALEKLLEKFGMRDFESGKAGGIPEEEEEKPKGKKK